MILQFQHHSKVLEFDSSTGIDISIPIQFFKENLTAFGVGQPAKKSYSVEGFTGNVGQGGSCNCDVIEFIPHCHGTHTECVGHILSTPVHVPNVIKRDFLVCSVVTVKPKGELGITSDLLKKTNVFEGAQALAIRTLPNDVSKKNKQYGAEAPYLTQDAIQWINDQKINHILVDFPSIDPIRDGGKLVAHREFWNVPSGSVRMDEQTWSHKSVTELVYIPNVIVDGPYVLDLQMSNLLLDAVPSSPVLFPLRLK